jgi:hypothetical protein
MWKVLWFVLGMLLAAPGAQAQLILTLPDINDLTAGTPQPPQQMTVLSTGFTSSSTPSTSGVYTFPTGLFANTLQCQVQPKQSSTTNVWSNEDLISITINWTGSVASAKFAITCEGY